MDRRVIDLSWVSLWRVFLFAAFVVILFIGRDIVLALFLALVVSSGLETMVTLMEKKGIPRTLGVILIFLGLALFLAIVIYFVIPFLLVDIAGIFGGSQQSLIGKLLSPLRGTAAGRAFTSALNEIAGQYLAENGSPLDFFAKFVGGAILGVTVIVTSFYLSLSKDGVERFVRAVFPKSQEYKALYIYERARRKVGYWFQSQLLLSLIMTVLVWGSLSLLGVKHAFVIAIFAGVLELMPFVGPIISGGMAVLIAMTTSASLGLYTLIVFLILQQIEAHVLVPLVTKRVVDIHPVIVIIALLIGAEAGGVLGALVSVPLAAVFQEVLEARSTAKMEVV